MKWRFAVRSLAFLLLWSLLLMPPNGAMGQGQIKDHVDVKDDIEAVATLMRAVTTPIDLVGTPLFNLWAEFWTFPARGADLLQYQKKYYYDYGTMTHRQTDAVKPAGHYPVGEYDAPDQRPRQTKGILYLPPKR